MSGKHCRTSALGFTSECAEVSTALSFPKNAKYRLIGAKIGGFCKYLSMVIGNKNLMFLVIGAYLVSLGFQTRLIKAGRGVQP
jgi:hypothetical protein